MYRYIPESPALHPEETYLVVHEPWDIIRGPYMDIFIIQRGLKLGLHSLCLRNLLGCQAGSVEHIQEICIPTDIQLIRIVHLYSPILKQFSQSPMDYCCPHLAFYVITNDRDISLLKTVSPFLIGCNKYRDAVDQTDTGFQAGLCVKSGRFL